MTSVEFWTGTAGALLIAATASSAGETLRVCTGNDRSQHFSNQLIQSWPPD